jgi:hypothetical protein
MRYYRDMPLADTGLSKLWYHTVARAFYGISPCDWRKLSWP